MDVEQMNGTVFVTGASGFIGGRLVSKLVKRGYQVTCLVRDPARAEALKMEGVRLVKGDITSKESMREPMKGVQAVFHVAGLYAIGGVDAARMQAINVDGARNTLELAAEMGVPKIVHTSTVGVFGNTHGKIVDESYRALREDMISTYELTKWMAHYQVAERLQNRGAPLIIVLPGGVTGAGDEAPHAMAFEMFLRRSPLMLGAKSGMTYAHVDDIAEGEILALEKGRAGESYVLAGEALTFKELFEILGKLSGARASSMWLPGWSAKMSADILAPLEKFGLRGPFSAEALKERNDCTYWATAGKAERELGWKRRPTHETLTDTLNYLQGKKQRDGEHEAAS